MHFILRGFSFSFFYGPSLLGSIHFLKRHQSNIVHETLELKHLGRNLMEPFKNSFTVSKVDFGEIAHSKSQDKQTHSENIKKVGKWPKSNNNKSLERTKLIKNKPLLYTLH